MNKKEEKIACHVCKKMIPKAAAVHPEGEEYHLAGIRTTQES